MQDHEAPPADTVGVLSHAQNSDPAKEKVIAFPRRREPPAQPDPDDDDTPPSAA